LPIANLVSVIRGEKWQWQLAIKSAESMNEIEGEGKWQLKEKK
jgi:hypothetical protein